MKKRILFIVNPIAGHHRKGFFARSVKTFLDTKQYDYTILSTEHAGHGPLLAEQAVREDSDIVAAVGGDGTVNEVARALIGTETALAIIAYGSGNGLARSMHLPLLHINAIKLLNTGSIRTIDTASVNGIPFVSIAGIGLDAQTAYDFSSDPRRGFLDAEQDTNYVRINRAFSGSNDNPINANEVALIADSCNYPGKLNAYLVMFEPVI